MFSIYKNFEENKGNKGYFDDLKNQSTKSFRFNQGFIKFNIGDVIIL